MTTATTNFLGIPIEGEINHGSSRVEQRPLSELEPLLRAVIDDDGIVDFGWRQYTPYFNDGDPCEFRVGDLWFRTTADIKPDEDNDDFDSYEYELGSGHPSLAVEDWDNLLRRYVPKVGADPETVARFQRCQALARAIGSGAFENVVLEAFGDHANVRIRRDGITVDEYSHD